ncbi:MAG: hypothetical protein AAGH81_12740, partial [Bacteroidota bacterium]
MMKLVQSSGIFLLFIFSSVVLSEQQKTSNPTTSRSIDVVSPVLEGSGLFLQLLSVSNTKAQDNLIETIAQNWD